MAKYSQRDLVYLTYPLPLPDGTELEHPVLILTCNSANSIENYYTGIMMTSSDGIDKFTFKCTPSMFEAHIKENSQLRLYLFVTFREENISRKANTMLKVHFQAVLKQVTDYVMVAD